MGHPYRTSCPPRAARPRRPSPLDALDQLVLSLTVLVGGVALLGACVAPSQHDAQRFGRWRVAFAGSLDGVYDWQPAQLARLRAALPYAQALGPDFVETEFLSEADTIVRAAGDLPGGACEVFDTGDPGVVRV